jgi:hypothetical protein
LKRVIIFAIFVLVLLQGCGKQSPGSEDKQVISEKDIQGFDPDIQEQLKRGQDVTVIEKTSFDNIQAALKDDKITKEQSVMLTLVANYDPGNLPEEYKGAEPTEGRSSSVQEAVYWLHENWGTLNAKSKELLLPFYVLPSDPKSFFNPNNIEKRNAMMQKLEVIPSVVAVDDELKVVDDVLTVTPRRQVSIFFIGNSSNRERVPWIDEAVRAAWPKFESLLGKRPTEIVYIYIQDTGSNYGVAYMWNDNGTRRCVIEVSNSKDKITTQSTAAHELFHCFQFYIPLKYDVEPRKWMMEATATWSEHYVFPEYNSEFEYLPRFFSTLEQDMITYGDNMEYSRYMWYLFVTQYAGSESIVKANLFSVKDTDGRKVVGSIDNFGLVFEEFALWNWNLDPELRYADSPSFPSPLVKNKAAYPNGDSYEQRIYNSKKESQEFMTLSNLAINYRLAVFTDNIDKVVYKFNDVGDSEHRRQVLVKIGDVWHWEDWTDIKERKFCRTRPEEKVKAILLIGSDAKWDGMEGYVMGYKVDTTGKCNPEWHGTTSFSWSFSHTENFPENFLSGPAVQKYMQDSRMTVYDTLVEDEENNEFLVTDQFITYYYRETQDTHYTQSCGTQSHLIDAVTKGSTHNKYEIIDNDFYDSDAPDRLQGEDDADSIMVDGKPTVYSVDLESYGQTDYLTTVDRRVKVGKPCEFDGLFTPSSSDTSGTTVDISKGSRMIYVPNDIKVERQAKRISGSQDLEIPWGQHMIKGRIDVDYSYG